MDTTDVFGLEIAKAAAEGVGKESANKLLSVVNGLFPFFGVKRQAVDTYISDIQNSDLPPEAKMIAIGNIKNTYKQLSNQISIAQIAQSVAENGTDFSETSGVDDQWLARFMDSAKFISDEQVQFLWGKILAKEFEQPNSTPPSVIRILSEITPSYARAFQSLCNLTVCMIPEDPSGNAFPVEAHIMLPDNYSYLAKHNISFSTLNELRILGLIQFDAISGYVLQSDSSQKPKIHLLYGDRALTINKYLNRALPIGVVILTDAGRSIHRFIEPQPIDEHFDAVVTYLRNRGVEIIDNVQMSEIFD